MANNNTTNTQRHWKKKTLTICSFNVLCQVYEPNHLPNNGTAFANRCPKLAESLWRADADICFLSEVNPISWYRHTFSNEYDILYIPKTESLSVPAQDSISQMTEEQMRSNNNDQGDGQAFMIRRNRVSLIKMYHVVYEDPDPAKFPQVSIGRARQSAMVGHFYHHEMKKTFFVCGSHFKADFAHDWIRIFHIKQLMKAFNTKIRVNDPHAPLFMCGDLNARPDSATMQLLLSGSCHFNNSQHLLGQSPFVSAMKKMSPNEDEDASFTIADSSWGGEEFKAVLDYILYEKSADVEGKVIPTACLTVPRAESYPKDCIPECGSDHLQLVCEFVIR